MKILIATPLYPPDIGGPATYAKTLSDGLPKHGVVVSVCSFQSVRHLPKGIAHVLYGVKLFRALRSADMLLVLDPVSVGLPATFVAFFSRKKFVLRIAGDYAWEQGRQRFGVKENLDEFVKKSSHSFSFPVRVLRFMQIFVARHSYKIVVPSKYLKSIVVAWGIPAEKIAVVYNAFDDVPGLPSREELRKRFGFFGPILFSAGRLVSWKGFDTLITLMPEIRKSYPSCRLFIAGSGPLAGGLRGQITRMHLDGAVTILGDVPQLKLMEYIHAVDCFVLNTGYEGLSHQLLETLAIGAPIVTTNVGGNPELIQSGVTGVLVEYNDKNMLEQAIKGVFANEALAQKMALAGKKFAANFTVERMVSETRSLLENTAKHP